jgi:hypothetical protein
MIGRNRRYGKGRRADLKTRLGIATAVIVGGGAIGVAAVATTQHSTPTATKAGYSYSGSSWNGGSTLSSALSSWSWNQTRSMTLLQQLQLTTMAQSWHNRTLFAAQRGILVLATSKFIIVKSNNGSLHLWALSGNTVFKNASTSMSSAGALTGSSTLASSIMANNMIPATSSLAGFTAAQQLVTPAPAATTVVVAVANTNVRVTVVVVNTTATVQTTNSFLTSAMLFRQSAFFATHTLTRGDLVLVVGTRSSYVLRAHLVLFAPLTTSDLTGTSSTGSTSVGGNSSTGFSGSHT